jgi:hypothetical protein
MNNQTKHWSIIRASGFCLHQGMPLFPKGDLGKGSKMYQTINANEKINKK